MINHDDKIDFIPIQYRVRVLFVYLAIRMLTVLRRGELREQDFLNREI